MPQGSLLSCCSVGRWVTNPSEKCEHGCSDTDRARSTDGAWQDKLNQKEQLPHNKVRVDKRTLAEIWRVYPLEDLTPDRALVVGRIIAWVRITKWWGVGGGFYKGHDLLSVTGVRLLAMKQNWHERGLLLWDPGWWGNWKKTRKKKKKNIHLVWQEFN